MSGFPVTYGAVYIGYKQRRENVSIFLKSQNSFLQCGLAKKGECRESLWTFNFLFGLLRVANCAWFCLDRFCRVVNKGQFIDRQLAFRYGHAPNWFPIPYWSMTYHMAIQRPKSRSILAIILF